MKIYNNPKKIEWEALCQRPLSDLLEQKELVSQIFKEIKKDGDSVLTKYTHFFDKVDLDDFKVSKQEIESAKACLKPSLKVAINVAKQNIEKFHKAQLKKEEIVETMPGVHCWVESRAIEKVGLYIPGGSAPLFSTVLMLGVPAAIAGCKDVVVCSPPNKNGEIAPSILYTAALCGIKNIYKVGGIQAIGAMTFGTDSIPSVYKIFGPGNSYVTTAKQQALNYNVAIDIPAGPSEVLVLMDEESNPEWVALDLISQAEHGADSQVVCIANSTKALVEVQKCIDRFIQNMSRREIIEKALKNSLFICFKEKKEQLEFINQYAPEHLIIQVNNAENYIAEIKNSGSVFIGPYSPESAGDYASGTNHTLPTGGFSKMYSGLGVESFMKKISFQKISQKGVRALLPCVEEMALAEGLDAHAQAIQLRCKSKSVGNETR